LRTRDPVMRVNHVPFLECCGAQVQTILMKPKISQKQHFLVITCCHLSANTANTKGT